MHSFFWPFTRHGRGARPEPMAAALTLLSAWARWLVLTFSVLIAHCACVMTSALAVFVCCLFVVARFCVPCCRRLVQISVHHRQRQRNPTPPHLSFLPHIHTCLSFSSRRCQDLSCVSLEIEETRALAGFWHWLFLCWFAFVFPWTRLVGCFSCDRSSSG